MTDQQIINAIAGLLGSIGGWLLRLTWQNVKEVQQTQKQLTEKVNSIEVLVAGKYVTRDELVKLNDGILSKLDRIETKLDRKVDR